MATMVTENERVGSPIVTTREPVGPKRAGDKGSVGDTAVMDAVAIVCIAWAILLGLAWTLRKHNL